MHQRPIFQPTEHENRVCNEVRSSHNGGGRAPELHRGALDHEFTHDVLAKLSSGELQPVPDHHLPCICPAAEAAGSPKRARFDEKLKFLPALCSDFSAQGFSLQERGLTQGCVFAEVMVCPGCLCCCRDATRRYLLATISAGLVAPICAPAQVSCRGVQAVSHLPAFVPHSGTSSGPPPASEVLRAHSHPPARCPMLRPQERSEATTKGH